MYFVRAASLTGYAEVASSFGLDPNRMLRLAGIDPTRIGDPDNRLPARNVAYLLELSATESRCRHFALALAERRSLATLGPLSLLLRDLETQREVLAAFTRYQQVLSDAVAFTIEEAGDMTLVHVQPIIQLEHDDCQGIELALAAVCKALRSFAGEHSPVEGAHFLHKAPADLTAHKRLFRCPLHFESLFNGLAYDTRALNAPIDRVHVKSHRYAEDYLETLRRSVKDASTSDRVRATLRILLPMGRGTLDQTSIHLGTHVRTLQRSLQEDGLTFAQILTETRRALCLGYLRDSEHSLQAISGLVGFGSASSFARWFQTEFGKSPSSWRADPAIGGDVAVDMPQNPLPSTQAKEIAWRQASERSAASRRRHAIIAERSKARDA